MFNKFIKLNDNNIKAFSKFPEFIKLMEQYPYTAYVTVLYNHDTGFDFSNDIILDEKDEFQESNIIVEENCVKEIKRTLNLDWARIDIQENILYFNGTFSLQGKTMGLNQLRIHEDSFDKNHLNTFRSECIIRNMIPDDLIEEISIQYNLSKEWIIEDIIEIFYIDAFKLKNEFLVDLFTGRCNLDSTMFVKNNKIHDTIFNDIDSMKVYMLFCKHMTNFNSIELLLRNKQLKNIDISISMQTAYSFLNIANIFDNDQKYAKAVNNAGNDMLINLMNLQLDIVSVHNMSTLKDFNNKIKDNKKNTSIKSLINAYEFLLENFNEITITEEEEKYHFCDDTYEIYMPKTIEELNKISDEFNNCIRRSYAKQCLNKDYSVFVLRNIKTNKNIACIGIKEQKIVDQILGHNNLAISENDMIVVLDWLETTSYKITNKIIADGHKDLINSYIYKEVAITID